MKVLSVSHDQVVLNARNEILRLNGYDVVASMNSSEALSLMRAQRFDAVVLGDSISLDERVALARELLSVRATIPIAFIRRYSDNIPDDLRVVIIDNLDPQLLLNKLKAAISLAASAQ